MKKQSFEIKIAIIGHVSVGKTTFLNALLGDKFSEVSKKRTTAGINHFRVSSLLKETPDTKDTVTKIKGIVNASQGTKSTHDKSSDDSVEAIMTADQTLSQITQANLHLRQNNKIQECTFDVELNEPLIDMLPNTNLIITDIPGVNEAGTSEMYLDYVKRSWDSYDCVIIVMDAVQGVNTEEQVNLLRFVKKHVKETKDVPVMILCNKVDDPDDVELAGLVDEVCKEVEGIFNVSDRKSALRVMLINKSSTDATSLSSPVFIPLSAENAFLYRAASRFGRDELYKLGKAYVDKIGHEEVGKIKWKRLSKKEQYEVVYDVVSDETQYQERLALSNFDKFLKVLEMVIGGEKNQANLIEKQLSIESRKLCSSGSFADCLSSIYDRSIVLGKSTMHLTSKFWKLYEECKDEALELFRSDPKQLKALYRAMSELEKYAFGLHLKVFRDGNGKADKELITNAAKNLFSSMCETVIKKRSSWEPIDLNFFDSDPWSYENNGYNYGHNSYSWYNSDMSGYAAYERDAAYRDGGEKDHPEADKYASHWEWDEDKKEWRSKYTGETKAGNKDVHPLTNYNLSWSNIYPRDWSIIMSSILLMKYSKTFCESFSSEIVNLDWYNEKTIAMNIVFCVRCNSRVCGCEDSQRYFDIDNVFQIKVPASPADEDHWGHLAWLYCKFTEKLDSNCAFAK